MSKKFFAYKKHTFVPENEVYFFETIMDAFDFVDKQLSNGEEWGVAVAVTPGRVLKWLLKLRRKYLSAS